MERAETIKITDRGEGKEERKRRKRGGKEERKRSEKGEKEGRG